MLSDGEEEAGQNPHTLSIAWKVWPSWYERLTCCNVSIPGAGRPGSTRQDKTRQEEERANVKGARFQERRSTCALETVKPVCAQPGLASQIPASYLCARAPSEVQCAPEEP